MTDMVDDEALEWAIRTGDPRFDDWGGFTDWLESGPENAARYDAAAAALADAETAVAAVPSRGLPEPVNDREPGRRSFLRWSGGAVAAALVGALGLSMWSDRSQPYSIETAAGEQRVVALADGSRAVMAGGSKLTLDRADDRVASLDRGQALFQVRHDAANPFRVRAGDLAMTDLGTVFDVRLGERETRVAVAEGAVMVDPDGARLRLDPGQAVVAAGDRLQREAADDVGGWREGRLPFDGASLDEVARDLSRHMGRTVRAAPDVVGRPFRGTLDTANLRNDPALLGQLLGVRVRAEGADWILERDR